MRSRDIKYKYEMLRRVYVMSWALFAMVLVVVILYGATAVRGGSYVATNVLICAMMLMWATGVFLNVRKFIGHLKVRGQDRLEPDATMQMLFEAAMRLAFYGLLPILFLGVILTSRPL